MSLFTFHKILHVKNGDQLKDINNIKTTNQQHNYKIDNGYKHSTKLQAESTMNMKT